MKYIATREGVEVLNGKGPATEKQKELVAKLLKDFPDMRDSFEYEDYKQAPMLHTASALISAALDSHMQNLQSENGYLKYIATRPGAEKHGAHGLFGREENTDLNVAMHDLTAHDGNVWTIIYSLHREDAERLGYNNAAAWRKLLVSQQNKFAEAFHIPASALHWYAAYHDADTHPHIHMMVWTDQETVLKRDAIVKLRSAMTNSIFQAELENLYIRKDIAYKDVTEAAREVMHDLVERMESVSEPPASIQEKLLEFALELRTVGGKKQYGYLKSHSRIWWIPSWTNSKSCRRWRHIIPSGMVCATHWRAITKTAPVSTIRSRSRKNSARSRTPSFRKQGVCGSRWSRHREHQNQNLHRRIHRLMRKLHRTLLQIRHLQTRILRLWLLILRGFHLNIF